MYLEKAKTLGLIKDHKMKFPLDIQLFAENGSSETDTETDGNNEPSSNEEGTDSDDSSDNPKMFTQDDVDKVVQKRLSRERKKWEQEQQQEQDEATKLAGMNEKQKKEYQEKKREDKLNEREKEITKRELTATAKEMLAEKGLPMSLSSILDYTDADSCNASIDVVEKAFQEAVQKAIDDKIKGGEVIKKAQGNSAKEEQDKVYNLMMGK